MDSYNLMMLDAAEILRSYKPIKLKNGNYGIRIDFTESATVTNQVIQSVDSYSENAMLYQLEKVLNTKEGGDPVKWDSDSLRGRMIFIDFKSVFRKLSDAEDDAGGKQTLSEADLASRSVSDSALLKQIFDPDYGITFTFEDPVTGEPENVHFVPFDKSASMARQSCISFIDSTVKDAIDVRLQLSLDFTKIDTTPSKYYAYRGLYLSDGHRINETDSLKFNSETVIVIPDEKYTNKKKHSLFGDICPGDSGDLNDKLWILGEYEESGIHITPFDGEGFVSLKYAGLINEQLGDRYGFTGDHKKEASSFQVRMPFTKGMLHTVDFQGFLSEQINDPGFENGPLWIRDFYGIRRDIRKAEIILTESMFKCCKWLNKFMNVRRDNEVNNLLVLEDGTVTSDPMEYYFSMFRHYDHALYIGNTDLVLSDSDEVKMNYQFLNTLDMSGDAFEEMVKQHTSNADLEKIIRNLCASGKDFLLTDSSDDDMTGESGIRDNASSPWFAALKKNRAFLSDPKVSMLVRGIRDSVVDRSAIGQIDVGGECRFLSCDLMSLLINIAERIIEGKDGNGSKDNAIDENDIAGVVRQSRDHKPVSLFEDRFYMASPRIKLDPGAYYGFLRNPHLSRNEQCLLRPYVAMKDSPYDRYFSHLSGVVMVSQSSLVPMALSGADHDGDLVKIISDKSVINAIKKGVYDSSGGSLQRKLPIIDIPKTAAREVPDKGHIPYDTVRNTFSNQIGLISNYAIRLTKLEAGGASFVKIGEEDTDSHKPNSNISSAACTVLTGLEIDAAKTGVHPTRNIEQIRNAFKDIGGSDYFLDAKEKFDGIRKGMIVKTDRKQTSYSIGYESSRRPYFKFNAYSKSDDVPNIDRLPSYYAVEKIRIDSSKESVPRSLAKKSVMFGFEAEAPDWRKQLDAGLHAEIKQLVEAYCGTLTIASRISRTKNRYSNTKFSGCVYNILKLQYDDLSDPLPGCGVTVQQALDSTYQLLDDLFESREDVQQSLNRLIDLNWQYTEENGRADKLYDILGAEEGSAAGSAVAARPDFLELITNFDNMGYKLLYYLLKDIISEKMNELIPEELSEEDKNAIGILDKLENLSGNRYFSDLYGEYSKRAALNEAKRLWQGELIKKSKKTLSKLMPDYDKALRHVYALRGIDRNAWFFWDILPADVILRNVYTGPALENEVI